MANRWGNNGNCGRLYFLGLPKLLQTVTATMKLKKKKKKKLLGRKVVTNLFSRLKSRNITLLTEVCLAKAMVFPVVIYGCDSWTIRNAECWRIDGFELWCWRRLFWVPWTARRSNQSIIKICPEYSLEGLMLKLKLQYFGHLMWRTDSLEKILVLGKIEGRKRRRWQRMRWFDGVIDAVDMSLSKLWEMVKGREAWLTAVRGLKKSQTWLTNSTTIAAAAATTTTTTTTTWDPRLECLFCFWPIIWLFIKLTESPRLDHITEKR